jgi:hypothetical protein
MIVPPPPLERVGSAARVARAGRWSVRAVHADGAPFPRACERRKASGPLRRIPNV